MKRSRILARVEVAAQAMKRFKRDPDDGSQPAALGFRVAFFAGIIAAAAALPGTLTLFWVWVPNLLGSGLLAALCQSPARSLKNEV